MIKFFDFCVEGLIRRGLSRDNSGDDGMGRWKVGRLWGWVDGQTDGDISQMLIVYGKYGRKGACKDADSRAFVFDGYVG